MADGVLRELLVAIGVEVDEKSIDVLEDRLGKVKEACIEIGKLGAAVAVGVAAAGVGLTLEARRIGEQAEMTKRNAAALSLSTDAYQELSYAIERTGGDARDMSDLLQQLSDYSLEAASGTETYVEAFGLLGLGVDDLRGKRPDELFDLVADGIARTTDPTKRLAAASRLLGDDVAKKMLPLLIRGSEGIGELRREAHTLGLVLNEEAIAEASAFAEESRKLDGTLRGLRNTLALAVLPTVMRLTEGFRVFIDRNRRGIQAIAQFIERWGMWIAAGGAALGVLGSMAAGLGLLAVVASSVVTVIGGLSAGLALLGGATVVGAAITGLVLLAAALTAPIAAVGIAVLAWEDLWVTLTGGRSVINTVIADWRDAGGVLGGVATVIDSIIGLVREVGDLLAPLGNAARILADEGFAYLSEKLEPFASTLRELANTGLTGLQIGLQAIAGLLDRISSGLDAIGNRFQTAFGGAETSGDVLAGARGIGAELAGMAFAPAAAPGLGSLPSKSYSSADTNNFVFPNAMSPQDSAAAVQRVIDQRLRAAAAALEGGDR